MDDGENLEPLLSVSVDVPMEGGDTGDDHVGGTTTLQKSFYENPRGAIKWLESKGTCKPHISFACTSTMHCCRTLCAFVAKDFSTTYSR
jgi:hypothetical protein